MRFLVGRMTDFSESASGKNVNLESGSREPSLVTDVFCQGVSEFMAWVVTKVVKTSRVLLSCALPIMIALGCGGCGGDGRSAGDGDNSRDGVRVLHASVEAAPVDVITSSSGSTLISQQFFAGTKGYHSLAATPQVLSMTRAFNPSDVLASFSLDAKPGGRYSLLLYGNIATQGLRTRLLVDDIPESFEGAVVRVVNGVTGAAAVRVTLAQADTYSVGFGQNTEYLSVKAGTVEIEGRRSADGLSLGAVALTAQEGRAYTVLFAGEAAFYSKVVIFTDL